jgi:aspartate ammonia-lyase
MLSDQITHFLKEVQIFKNFDSAEIEQISDIVEISEYERDMLIFTEHSPRKKLYMIYEGEVELFKKTSFGEEKRLSFFRKYDFLGEGALMDNYPHSVSARALLKTTVLFISREKFETLTSQKSGIAIKMLSNAAQIIANRMRQASTRFVNESAQYISGRTRSEHDLLGDREVPYEMYYGVQTMRAMENFNISGISLSHFPVLIEALAMIKMAAAKANHELGLLSKPIMEAIVQACNEIINGKFHAHFVVDMVQGGAGHLPI